VKTQNMHNNILKRQKNIQFNIKKHAAVQNKKPL